MRKERSQFNVRADLPTLYLLDIACRIENVSQSDLVRNALRLYFEKAVSPRLLDEFEEAFPGHELPSPEAIQQRKAEAKKAQMEHSLAKYADLLWEEKPFDRLMKLNTFFPHLLTDFDRIMLEYLMQDERYSKALPMGRSYKTTNISAADFEQLQAEAFAWHKAKGE